MTAPDALLTDLRAALDEAERVAREATEGPWCFYNGDLWRGDVEPLRRYDADPEGEPWPYDDEPDRPGTIFLGEPERAEDAEHAAARNPKWTLDLIAADRETLDDIATIVRFAHLGRLEPFAIRVLHRMARVWLTDDQLRAHGIER